MEYHLYIVENKQFFEKTLNFWKFYGKLHNV
jgi:hypothetical protein